MTASDTGCAAIGGTLAAVQVRLLPGAEQPDA